MSPSKDLTRRKTIGFFIPNMFSKYFENQWFIMQQAAREKDFNLVIFCPFLFLNEQAAEERDIFRIFQYARDNKIDGFIVSSVAFSSYLNLNYLSEVLTELAGVYKIPIVSLSKSMLGCHAILLDNKAGIFELTNHCIQQHNYSEIAFIKGLDGNIDAEERFEGYREALELAGIPYRPELVLDGDFGFLSGKQAVRTLLDTRKILPRCLLAANDDMIWGAYTELQTRGIKVPEQIALGGFDNNDTIKELEVPISSVHQPLAEQMLQAVSVLLDMLNGQEVSANTILPTRAVIRQSCGCSKQEGRDWNSSTLLDDYWRNKFINFQGKKDVYEQHYYGFQLGFISKFSTAVESLDLDKLKQECIRVFQIFHFKICHIFLNDLKDPVGIHYTSKKDLPVNFIPFLLYEQGMPVPDAGPGSFGPGNFLQEHLLETDKQHTFFFCELLFQQEYLGFMLVEMDQIDAMVINLFKLTLSIFLHNVRQSMEKQRVIDQLKTANALLQDKELLLSKLVDAKTREIEGLTLALITSLENANMINDDDTGNHILRVSEYSWLLAYELTHDVNFAAKIKRFAPLHDIGKIGVPDELLKKPGKINQEEFELMKQHVSLGSKMLEADAVPQIARNIVLYHHEKWNGSGYLKALKGTDIPLEARIVALADVYDALGTERVYKPAFPEEQIDEIIREESGRHFDPDLTTIYFRIKPELLRIKKSYQRKPG